MPFNFLPRPGRHQSIDGSSQSGKKRRSTSRKATANATTTESALATQRSDLVWPTKPRWVCDGDEGELTELDADVEADQRAHHGIARQAELGERAGEAQPMHEGAKVPLTDHPSHCDNLHTQSAHRDLSRRPRSAKPARHSPNLHAVALTDHQRIRNFARLEVQMSRSWNASAIDEF
jgi:hypothetical protein